MSTPAGRARAAGDTSAPNAPIATTNSSINQRIDPSPRVACAVTLASFLSKGQGGEEASRSIQHIYGARAVLFAPEENT